MSRYAEVIVDIAASDVDRLFTYSVPEGMNVIPGARVNIPFGPRKIEGYVISLKDDLGGLDEAKVRAVINVIENETDILPELMSLAVWMKETYHCLLVDSLRLMIPLTIRNMRVKRVTQVGLLVFGEDFDRAFEGLRKAPKRQSVLSLLKELCDNEDMLVPLPILQGQIKGCLPMLKALRDMGYVRIEDGEATRRPYNAYDDALVKGPELTRDQARSVSDIKTAMDELYSGNDGSNPRFLLHGITGSGKTEVYMHSIGHALSHGRGAIFLVPEISLTPQMVSWFRQRFGPLAAVIHSALSAGERYDEWRRIKRGDAKVVIGARSAIFAPVNNLGIIIIDEEHEGAYISDRHPRYDTREVAARRCDQENAALILGSATPSLKTFAYALRGKYELLELMERVKGRQLPETTIVDMRTELALGNNSVLSSALVGELTQCLNSGKQAILFINRRGYSPFVSCRACGFSIKCDQCDVSMTYHQVNGIMRCHYCGAFRRPPETCPKCGSKHIKYFGAGTQKVEEAVAAAFPGVSALRMDNDTTRQKDAHEKLISRFREGEARILIGTQMIAKGLDFPNVTLVGVVAADSTLNLPDYQSYERTFQLITQVSGRAGRADFPGKVVVQTYDPEHYAVALAAEQNYRAFYTREMERRRRGLYPPFTFLVRLLVSGKIEDTVRGVCEGLEGEMEGFFRDNPVLLRQVVQMRSMAAPITYIRGEFRWQLFLKLYAKGPTDEILVKLDDLAKRGAEAGVVFEVNPPTML